MKNNPQMNMTKRFWLAAAIISASALPSFAHGSTVLANEKIRVMISDFGSIERVDNRLAGERYEISSDAFSIETDRGLFSNRSVKPDFVGATESRVEYRYEFAPVGADGKKVRVGLAYSLDPDEAFIRRWVTVDNEVTLRVQNISLGKSVFAEPFQEVVHYVTFIAAPTVEFLRHQKGGMFTGIENPFFSSSLAESEVTLSFEPGLILSAGEGYTSEPQFLGVYARSGVMLEDSGREFRYSANGSGYKPIDRNEMRAMRAYALNYLAPVQKRFLNINYQFFHPLPQMPETKEQMDYFTKTIDTFAEIGGDMIIFKPLHPYTKPDVNRPYWDVVPEDQEKIARQIVDYARERGIGYGFYMGCAAHGKEGNAAGLTFRPDKPEWKKTDAVGRRAPDNCLASDDYYNWWFAVQNNTIQKYGLRNWSWDPSLGSGMNCYDESHGHIAGKGAYKGWQHCLKLMHDLKASNPGLFIQGFYGTKNFGLWGLKYVDQHEVYNEQTIIVSTKHHQISDDRQNADGLRFQNNWSMRFRFTPAITGHALVHRISEGGFDPELIKAWDFFGWKYALLSALAVSGSVMPTILPYETSMVPGYVDFYKKWTGWAKDNFEYVNYTEPIGEQVQPGAVDAYARIKGDHGFMFLFNGNPRSAEFSFEVGDEINLQVPGDYEFIELYPTESPNVAMAVDGRSNFSRGDSAHFVVPANGCVILELRKSTPSKPPVLIGAAGSVKQSGERVEVSGVQGKPGQVVPMRVRLPGQASGTKLRVNGTEYDYSAEGNELAFSVKFEGVPYARELDNWTTARGERFSFPNPVPHTEVSIQSTFSLDKHIPALLKAATPRNASEMAEKIAAWQKARGAGAGFSNSYLYHNFIGERPERLWLIIPFLTKTECEIQLNGRPVSNVLWDDPSSSAFVDITDLAQYGSTNTLQLNLNSLAPNSFMGPFLMYPEEPVTHAVSAGRHAQNPSVIFRSTLIPAPATRYKPDVAPVITDARMMANVTLTCAAELRVKVSLPPAKIRSVQYFESGFTWMGQHPLKYDENLDCWVGSVAPGARDRIQENEDIYVWAEDVDGVRSEYCPVTVGWDFL